MSGQLAVRYGSPRSARYPMAFTFWELVRGGFIAVTVFNLLAPLLSAVVFGLLPLLFAQGWVQEMLWSSLWSYLPAYLIYTPVFSVPWSMGALLVGMPLVYALGRSLRGITSRRAHLIRFAVLGAFVGAVAIMLWVWTGGWPIGGMTIFAVAQEGDIWRQLLGQLPLVLSFAALTSASVVYGWHLTAKWALRDDALRSAAAQELPPTGSV